MRIYWKVLRYKVLQMIPTPSYLYRNSSFVWAETFSFFLTLLGLSIVKNISEIGDIDWARFCWSWPWLTCNASRREVQEWVENDFEDLLKSFDNSIHNTLLILNIKSQRNFIYRLSHGPERVNKINFLSKIAGITLKKKWVHSQNAKPFEFSTKMLWIRCVTYKV
jgi:hypothetical protein